MRLNIRFQTTLVALTLLLACVSLNAQKVKNVIVLIPDGCSLATVSTARWHQWYSDPKKEHLAIDPYICGTVRTSCSNAPIGDSAPTTSCYMTGYMSRAGWVATYPTAAEGADIYPVDPKKAYQPLTTILEASKLLGKSTGLVCTCEFPQATPADCAAHSYSRQNYGSIAPQQAHNKVNVLIGGGTSYLNQECEEYLTSNGWTILKDDLAGMRSCNNDNMWALYGRSDMPYDIDRDTLKYPSLAEMTKTAITKLSHNKKGFFLMVEGSKVDWAAHDNDPKSLITEYIAFDKACGEAIEFAKRDGNTAVVVVTDHGNSGVSLGRRDMKSYSSTSAAKLFEGLSKIKVSADEMAKKINAVPFNEVQNTFKEWCGFELSNSELDFLKNCSDYTQSPIAKENRKQVEGSLYSSGLSRAIAQFMTARTCMSFTTNGHTGEEVILVCYHPDMSKRPTGMITNVELNGYLCSYLGFKHDYLDELTSKLFVPHRELFKDEDCTIVAKNSGSSRGGRPGSSSGRPSRPGSNGGPGGSNARPGGGPGGSNGSSTRPGSSNSSKGGPGSSKGGPGASGAPKSPRSSAADTLATLTVKTATGDIVFHQSSNLVDVHTTKGEVVETKTIELPSVVVYVDKNNTFYVPRDIMKEIEGKK